MMKQGSREAVLRAAEAGDARWWFGGGVHIWKLTSADTDGAFCMFEDLLERGKVTPLHAHADADETLYVIEGELRVRTGERELVVGPGGVALFPRGVPHAFMCTSETARVLCIVLPGSAERFYLSASEPTQRHAPSGTTDFQRVREAGIATGACDILGPPPFGSRS